MSVFLIVLGLLGTACAAPRQSRIVGGEATTIEKNPFMASMLELVEEGVYLKSCGGTLLTATAVITACHCLTGLTPASSRVRLGSTLGDSGGIVHIASKIVLHPQYNETLMINDVAVFRLRERAVYSQQINSSRIAGPNYNLPTNTVVSAIGWGRLEFEGNRSEILREVEINVIDHKLCAARYEFLKTYPGYENYPSVTFEMFCTGILNVGGKDSCQGDSGGPIMHRGDILVGIISWGYECAHNYFPSVNVRVSNYTNWITSNLIN